MPMDRSLYPDDWESIATKVKEEANWTCKECGKLCRRPGKSLIDFAHDMHDLYGDALLYEVLNFPQRFTLTVAHLNHIPSDCDRSNLKALCSVCHCRYDLRQMSLKRRLKAERNGQLSLPL